MSACAGEDLYEDIVSANDAIGRALCIRAHECQDQYPEDVPVPFELVFGRDVAGCIDSFALSPEFAHTIREAVDTGRLLYDPAAARACNQAIRSLSCANIWHARVPACDDMYMGTVLDGESCVLREECVSGFCRQGQCAGPPG